MFEFKRFCLYVLPLFLSSALAEEAAIRKNINEDYNLMQNLLIQLEQETSTQINKKLRPVAKKRPSSQPSQSPNEITTEDQTWLEDQIGRKQAAPIKDEPRPSTSRKIRKRSR